MKSNISSKMFKLGLVSLLVVYGVSGGSFTFSQISQLVNSALNCLETNPNLSPNATFQVVLGLAYLTEIYDSVSTLPPDRLEIVNIVERRLTSLIEKALINHPDALGSMVWRSSGYHTMGNFTLRRGLVPEWLPLEKSLSEVISDSAYTPLYLDCTQSIFEDNPPSDGPRLCKAKCHNIMTDPSYYSEVPPGLKAWYLGYEFGLNCTNLPVEGYQNLVFHFCKYVKREVDTMIKNKDQPLFEDSKFIFMRKDCSGWGVAEFLSERNILNIIGGMDCDGCVAADRSSEDRDVLTAQTLAILCTTLRLVAEEDQAANLLYK